MSNNEGQVKRIHAKLHQVLKQHALLQKENTLLKEELKSNKELLTVQQQDIEGLRQPKI
jgi:hypothetical protein